MQKDYLEMNREERVKFLAEFSRGFHHLAFSDVPVPTVEESEESIRRCFKDADKIRNGIEPQVG